MAQAPAFRLIGQADSLKLARKLFIESLSASHKRCLDFVVLAAKEGGKTLSEVSGQARENGITSEPSARRLIQRLRSLGLVSCGFSGKKGLLLTITPLGKMILDGVENGNDYCEVRIGRE